MAEYESREVRLAFAQSVEKKVSESIYGTGKKFKLDVILQTHSEKNSQNITRYCQAPKSEVLRRCLISLVKSLNACGNHIDAKLFVLDDHSSSESVSDIHESLKNLRFPSQFVPLEQSGIMPSILSCYEWGLRKGRGELVYFAQDDYLHEISAIEEMVDSYFRFKFMLGDEIGIYPFNDPYRYYVPGNIENTRIVQGLKRHWRVNYFTASCFMVHHHVIEKNWDLFEAMGRSEVGPAMEDETINRLWQQRGVRLFTPIPSLALHLQSETEKDPYIDWRMWWDASAR